MPFLTSGIKLAQLFLFAYTAVAVLYTTHRLFVDFTVCLVSFVSPGNSRVDDLQANFVNPSTRLSRFIRPDHGQNLYVNTGSDSALSTVSDPWPAGLVPDTQMYWPVSELVKKMGMDHSRHTPVREATFLGKAFAHAMHPTRIIPFYYRATHAPAEDDVTISTLVTANRFEVFRQLVERYQGPISVTIHIPFPSKASIASLPPTHPSSVAMRRLHELYTSSPLFAAHVDVHLALSPFAASARGGGGGEQDGEGEGGRQFNVWRNAARLFARTEFVMILDVDFAVCTDWRADLRDAVRRAGLVASGKEDALGARGNITTDLPSMVDALRAGTAALVVPAFEYVRQEDGADQRTFPMDKESLLRLTRKSPPALAPFHASWAAGHNSTDYPRYDALPPGSGAIYRVTTYQSAYEPYVIVSRRVSWCDERFTGYGANKAACLFEMYLSGVSFYVLADHFVIHQSHTYEEKARREERKYNRKLYADFKEEVCIRYLDRTRRDGTLAGMRGLNVQEECSKIRSVAKVVGQVAEALG
ncbi:glycosyl-transferase for dystroglycan-domain-containing protein [Amylocystis lapponica]|nr:glycosyl-transferase for dystroglycan-domain-containing protein [Amylocystis lapponica]